MSGPTGPTGQGIQGPTGQPGIQGPTGPSQGPTGPTGSQGQITPWTSNVNAANYSLYNTQTVTFDQLYPNTFSSGTNNINFGNAQKQSVTLNGSVTVTFTAPLGPGNFVLEIIQGTGGSFTITWPTQGLAAGNLAWVGKTVPTLSTAAGAVDIISIFYNGVSYYGSYGVNFG